MRWVKASASYGNSNCVEVGLCPPEGEVRVRDSKNPSGPVLTFTVAEWRTFIAAVTADQAAATVGAVTLLRVDDDWWEMHRTGVPALALTFNDGEIEAFADGAVRGEFDLDRLAAMCGAA